ncbi:hypothetical protein [Planococcus sp. YIM B11945]|uniref:hypothetical protein n=1 Tax=Planococcus sp. YIM B11945 TaxID=3435410 RepID=UPI003D7D4E18
MAGELILVLEEYETSFTVRLIDRNGKVYSHNYFSEIPDIANVRTLIATLTHIFGNFNRVTYSKDIKSIWDHEARPDAFGKFMAELFASQNNSSNKYQAWEQFSNFLEELENEAHRDYTADLPF